MSAEKPCTFKTTLWEQHQSGPYPAVRQPSQEVLQNFPKAIRDATEQGLWPRRCDAVRQALAPCQLLDVITETQRKQSHQGTTLARPLPPQFPSQSRPFPPLTHPALPQPVLIFRQTCVSMMAVWLSLLHCSACFPSASTQTSPGPKDPGSQAVRSLCEPSSPKRESRRSWTQPEPLSEQEGMKTWEVGSHHPAGQYERTGYKKVVSRLSQLPEEFVFGISIWI